MSSITTLDDKALREIALYRIPTGQADKWRDNEFDETELTVWAAQLMSALRAVRDAAYLEAAEAICGGCARGWPLQFGRHQITPGSSMPCAAHRIRALIPPGET